MARRSFFDYRAPSVDWRRTPRTALRINDAFIFIIDRRPFGFRLNASLSLSLPRGRQTRSFIPRRTLGFSNIETNDFV